MAAAEYVEAYAACGGYPLHLRRWDPGASPTENLREQAFTPGGLLLRDALDILSEDLDWRGGYERVLSACLVAFGELPARMTIGRWWRDELAEIDVLGLLDGRTRLAGAARWQSRPLTWRDLQDIRAKLSYLPEPHLDLELAFWIRGGADAALSAEPGLRLFTCDDMT